MNGKRIYLRQKNGVDVDHSSARRTRDNQEPIVSATLVADGDGALVGVLHQSRKRLLPLSSTWQMLRQETWLAERLIIQFIRSRRPLFEWENSMFDTSYPAIYFFHLTANRVTIKLSGSPEGFASWFGKLPA